MWIHYLVKLSSRKKLWLIYCFIIVKFILLFPTRVFSQTIQKKVQTLCGEVQHRIKINVLQPNEDWNCFRAPRENIPFASQSTWCNNKRTPTAVTFNLISFNYFKVLTFSIYGGKRKNNKNQLQHTIDRLHGKDVKVNVLFLLHESPSAFFACFLAYVMKN